MTYKTIFSSFHTIYRLTTTSGDLVSFTAGVCRLFRNLLKASKVVMICTNGTPQAFLKIRLENKKQFLKKGGKSILTRIEKEILKQEKEISFGRRLIYPFIFNETLGTIYVKRDSRLKLYSEAEKRWFYIANNKR